jgi:hypothetical protein
MDYDPDVPRTPPRNDRTNNYTELNAPFTPVSVASSLVPTVVDDMSPYRIDEITNQANRHVQSRLYKKVHIRDMIILNHLGQVVDDLYKLVPFTYDDKRSLRDGLWDDHIYNMHGENITRQHPVETSHNQDIAAILNSNSDSDSGSGQNPRKRRRAGGKRTHKKNSKKNNSKNNKRSSKKNNSKK